jgi:glucose/mannose transport system substrate-binding protein
LPRHSAHPDLIKEFLGVLGSKQGQETFSKLAGSICARTDCDYSEFDAYLQNSADDWKVDTIVPSLTHSAAAPELWTASVIDAVERLVASGDVASAQAALVQACVRAGACQ